MATNIDLHIHSTRSDGTLSPKEILRKAKNYGVGILSICDHDSVGAYTKEFFNEANSLGIKIICGVEMSTRYFDSGFHILGYNMNIENKEFLGTLKLLQNARINYVYDVEKALNKIGYILHPDEIIHSPSVGKPHVTRNVLSNPQNYTKLIEDFGHIPSVGEFIETLLNEGCPAYVEKFSISPMNAAEIIRKAGGKVVLAHPVAYIYQDGVTREQISELVSLIQPDGIEAYYLFTDTKKGIINETDYWVEFAKQRNLLCTIGSDYHTSSERMVEIGFYNTDYKIPETDLSKILETLNIN